MCVCVGVYMCVVVKEVGEGGGKKRKRQGGRMTKGGRRNGEHEVGLDRTIGLQVTFELPSARRLDYGFVEKRFSGGICFSAKE